MGNFLQRIRTQLNHVQHLLQTVFDVVKTHHMPEERELTRDAFGLHTIIVAVTSTGKVNTKPLEPVICVLKRRAFPFPHRFSASITSLANIITSSTCRTCPNSTTSRRSN